MKPGRQPSPCKKCGGNDRLPSGHCRPCYNEYMREYRKNWVAARKKEMEAKRKEEKRT